jgi:S-DNA-T family DNA segregation ATPase FtsK/SpoIIIE
MATYYDNLPDMALLRPAPLVTIDPALVLLWAKQIASTLVHFQVSAVVEGVTTGPRVVQFQVRPAPGVRIKALQSIEAELGMALGSIVAVRSLPGRRFVAIEVARPQPQVVTLRETLEDGLLMPTALLPIPIGKGVGGQVVAFDLAKAPHVLIAGSTGSGKSVAINTLLTALLMQNGPDSLRLLMVDPKRVELAVYAGLPHLMHEVVTEVADAVTLLNIAVEEMNQRYDLLQGAGVRNLQEYNDGIAFPLPLIVVVVDELADLMLSAKKMIEPPLVRLAQMARAVGIHLVVATQRPSADVITGLIKANFPTRMAFAVTQRVNSGVILDQNGAEKLLGQGDMLLMAPGGGGLQRVQTALVTTEEVTRVVAYWEGSAVTTARQPAFIWR